MIYLKLTQTKDVHLKKSYYIGATLKASLSFKASLYVVSQNYQLLKNKHIETLPLR